LYLLGFAWFISMPNYALKRRFSALISAPCIRLCSELLRLAMLLHRWRGTLFFLGISVSRFLDFLYVSGVGFAFAFFIMFSHEMI
jgi:hypothetical protein